MCSSKSRLHQNGSNTINIVAKINGRAVLQPKSNQVPTLERRNSLKKDNPTKTPTHHLQSNLSSPPPLSPSLKSSIFKDPSYGLNSSITAQKASTTCILKKSKKSVHCGASTTTTPPCVLNYSSSLVVEGPAGSIAAARREQVSIMQEQRKLKIAYYGRLKSTTNTTNINNKVAPLDTNYMNARQEKRCTFITPTSDPIYVAYHDEEWGVPVHDDMQLFELLVLTGAQVGSDWTSVLKKRPTFRDAFSGFDAEVVAKFTEKKIISITSEYGIDISLVRGVVDNSNRILQVKKEYGSLEKYLWGFVNHKAIRNQYKSSNKIPVKTSKSESISKDMVKRGFRNVGPTVIHSFMQAAGLTNDHLTTCPRHLHCSTL